MPRDTETKTRKPPPRNRPAGKQKITRETYDALCDAFRENGENFRAVSVRCGVGWETAKRAWERGWHDQKSKPWARPIRDVVQREQVLARAALEREKQALVNDHRIARQDKLREAIEQGFNDLVDSKAKQGKVIRAARDNSIATLVISQRLLKAAIPLSDEIANELNNNSTLDVFQRMRLLRQLGRFAHDAIEMAQVVEEMERKALGSPDTIVEVQHTLNMTPDEAKSTLLEVQQILGSFENGADIDEIVDVEWSENDELAVPVTDEDEQAVEITADD